MKKKIFILMLMIFTFMFKENVLAEEHLVMDYQTTPYYYRVWSDKIDSGKLTFFELNGDVAYCVEPGVHVSDEIYLETDINALELDNNTLNRIKLIGYYGYEYPNHQTYNYRMATQELLWETLQNVEVSYWTGKNQTGDYLNIDNEKMEIMNLVNNHYIKPNISNNLYLSFRNDNILYDTNNVLNNFEVINNNSNLDVYIKNNELHIDSNIIGDYEITLRKKKYNNKTTILYSGSNGISQKLIKLRVEDDVELKINIHIVGGKLFLQKLNSENNSNKSIGLSSLSNAIYGIYDENNYLIEKLSTNELGESISNYLKFGKYYLTEIEPSYGYKLNNQKYYFDINENSLEKELVVLEDLIKNEITVIKTLESNYSLLDIEPNITFEIYLNNKDLYQTITTDNNGIAKVNLPYGEYLFHQVNTTEGYLKSDDFIILVNENTEDQVEVVNDKRVRGKIEIVKSDAKTNERLKNALIEISKDDKLIFQGYTNESGIIELNDLYVGEYKIKEIKAPNDYILDNTEYLVNITNDNQIISLEIKNEHEEVIVPNTGLNESKRIRYESLILLMLGILIVIMGIKGKINQ